MFEEQAEDAFSLHLQSPFLNLIRFFLDIDVCFRLDMEVKSSIVSVVRGAPQLQSLGDHFLPD